MEELRVVITADASGVGPGVAEATAAVQSGADAIAVAQQKATASSEALAAAVKRFGTSAATAGTNVGPLIASLEAENDAAQAALAQVTALTEAVAAQTPVMEENAAAVSGAAAATQVLGVSARQGATAGIGILEGRMMSGNRAAAAFLSTTLGLGPAIQAAFPIIGALALGEVLLDIGKHAYDLYEKFIDISTVDDKLIADFEKMRNQDLFNVHSIETATRRMDEATASATTLREAADALHKSSSTGFFQDLLTGNTTALGTDIALLAGAKKLADEGGKQTEDAVKLGLIRLKQEHELTLEKITAAHAADGLLEKEQQITAEHAKRLEVIKENQTYEHKEERALGNTSPSTAGDEMSSLLIKQADAEERVALARDHGRENYEQEAAALKLQGADLGAILLFWERINADGEHNTEVLRAQEELLKQIDGHGTIKGGDAGKALVEPAPIRDRSGLGGEQETPEQQAARIDASIGEQIDAKQRLYEQNLRNIQAEERLGLLTGKEANAAALKLQREAEAAERAPLEKRQQDIAPLGITGLDQKQLKEYDDLQKKLDQIAQRGALERERIAQQEAVRIEQVYKRVATTFNSDFEKAFNEWATKSKTAGQAFGAMLGQMELQLIDFVAKWLLQQAEKWALTKILDATGFATQRATQTAANVGMIASDASVAAAGTMAFYSAINPIIAPAMAGAAYAETMSYSAGAVFDGGGMMPHMGFAMNTSGSPERVLSPSQTSNFESLVNNGGSRNATLNQTNNFGGGVTKDMLDAHTSRTMSQLRAMIRPEALA